MRKKLKTKRFTSYKRRCQLCGKYYRKEEIKGAVCNDCKSKRFRH